jgi:hypothetical protein
MYVRDIAHEHGATAYFLDRKAVDGFDDVWAVVHRQRVVFCPDLDVPRRQNDVLLLQSIAHIRRGHAARLKSLWIQVSHDDARLAAVGIGHLGAMHNCQRRSDDVLSQVVEFRVR